MTLFWHFSGPRVTFSFLNHCRVDRSRLIKRPRLAIGSSKKAEFLNEKKLFLTNCFKKGQMSIRNHWFLGINYSKISNALKKEVYFEALSCLVTKFFTSQSIIRRVLKSIKSLCDISTTPSPSERHVFEWPLITDFILLKINN